MAIRRVDHPQTPKVRRLAKEIPGDQAKTQGKARPLPRQIAKPRPAGLARLPSKPIPRPRPTGPPQCTNATCDKSDIASEEGQLLCRSCGTVVAEQHITSSINFGEASNGAAVVQGSYLSADQTHVRLRGPGGSRVVGGQDTREVAEYQGKQLIRSYCEALTLSDTIKDRACQVYKLAIGQNFIQGREARKVAAASVYIGCRRSKENRTMLMDLADLLNVNVFKLGHVFTALVDTIGLANAALMPINAEALILRFAERLEFGADMYRVAGDAVKIMARFDRDWMVTGRRPSGLCGAALILAARMNNYRRTIREVVYLVKVSDMTIQKRLNEFKVTPSSDLTVEEFRNRGHTLEGECDPPAFNRKSRPRQKRRKKNNGTAEDEQVSDQEQSNASSANSSRENSVAVGSRRAQSDNVAMPPPPVPIDPELLAVPSQSPSESAIITTSSSNFDSIPTEHVRHKRKRGRPPKTALPTPSPSQLADESRIENEISAVVTDPRNQALANSVHQAAQSAIPNSPSPTPIMHPNSQDINTQHNQPEHELSPTDSSTPLTTSIPLREHTKTSSQGITADAVGQPTQAQVVIVSEESDDESDDLPPSDKSPYDIVNGTNSGEDLNEVSSSEVIGEDEFLDDPEVQDCKLSEDEIAIKERIWTHLNRDYLRQQQAKLVRQELEAAYGTGRVIVRRKRKRARMGDMSAYGKDGESSGYPTPIEAVKAMMGRRAYSKKVNYETLKELYEKSDKSGGQSKEASTAENASGEEDVSDEEDASGEEDALPSSPQESNASSPQENLVETVQTSETLASRKPTVPTVTTDMGDLRDEDVEMSDNPDDYVTGPEEELDYLAQQYGSEDGYDEQGGEDYDEYGGEEVE